MIQFRDTHEPPQGRGLRTRRGVQATWGVISGQGANRTEAKAALMDAVDRQLAHVFARRYLATRDVTFALFYANGWCYDIVTSDGAQHGSTHFDAANEHDAFEAMRRHFEQYTETPGPT
jgi:hypothetical protein